MKKIKIAIIGLGNCASSLLQGIEYYKSIPSSEWVGLMHTHLGGYSPLDIEIVAAFDIDARKVGKDVSEAIFAPPNCTKQICSEYPLQNIKVSMGKILDGIAPHMKDYPYENTFIPSNQPEPDKNQIIEILKKSGAQILLNYLPVGSIEASYFYVECALEAGLGVINNIPVFIASSPEWQQKFKDYKLPIIGDDIKSQFGATIIHRTLAKLMENRGVKISRSYQLNTGGNTDFLNMLDESRLIMKRQSKTEAVQSILKKKLEQQNVHIGPSDYVAWQKDNKVCYLRLEGEIFGNIPIELELRLSVEDSPNSAGVAIDMIRCCKIALDRGLSGTIHEPSAYFCKHPPIQLADDEAHHQLNNFIRTYEN